MKITTTLTLSFVVVAQSLPAGNIAKDYIYAAATHKRVRADVRLRPAATETTCIYDVDLAVEGFTAAELERFGEDLSNSLFLINVQVRPQEEVQDVAKEEAPACAA